MFMLLFRSGKPEDSMAPCGLIDKVDPAAAPGSRTTELPGAHCATGRVLSYGRAEGRLIGFCVTQCTFGVHGAAQCDSFITSSP
ncbi:MAG: hypothetical protein JSR43_08590 [Proteobacteria bacterium]|nr:hypothetical protein [Pseudomonadota bacterium]